MRPLFLFLLLFLPVFLFFFSPSPLRYLSYANRIAPSRDKRSRSGKMRERRTTLAITIPYAVYIYIYFFPFLFPVFGGCPLAFRRFRRSSDCATARRPMSLSTDRFSTERSRGEHRLGQITVPLYVIRARFICLFIY